MAVNRFIGQAVAVAQVDKFTPANVEIDDVFTLTMTGIDGTVASISFTATAATVANVTAGLTAAWNASTNALISTLTASDQTTYMDLTADTAGVGFTVTSTATDGGGTDDQTLTRAEVTHNSGPSEWEIAANWSQNEIPGASASADVYVEGATILYGLNQSGISNELSSLNILGSQIGSIPASGRSPSYLQIKTAELNIDKNVSSGTIISGKPVNIDLGTTPCVAMIVDSGVNSDTTIPSVNLKANSANTLIYVRNGIVGIASFPGETTTILTLSVDDVDRSKRSTSVHVGENVTMTNYNQAGGECISQSLATTTTVDGGVMITEGSDTATTLNVSGGIVYSNSKGAIATANVSNNGKLDFTQSREPRTVTNVNLDDSGTLSFDPGVMVFTNGITQVNTTGNMTYKAQ